jgi:hypothetical protein
MTWSRQISDGEQSPRTRRFMKAARGQREWLGESREVTAARSGLRPSLIRDLELGRRGTLTLDEAVALASALGTTVVQLLGEEI